MKSLMILLIFLNTVAYADGNGIGVETGKDETVLEGHDDIGNVRVGVGAFHLEQGETNMYGLRPQLGYKVLDYDSFKLYGLVNLNAGITISPEDTYSPCTGSQSTSQSGIPSQKIQQIPTISIPAGETDNSQIQSAVSQFNKNAATYNNDQTQNNKGIAESLNSLSNSETSMCSATRKTAAELSPYGAAMFYEVGLQPAIAITDHLYLNAFIGYRWQDEHHYMNIGDLDVNGPVARIGLSLEF